MNTGPAAILYLVVVLPLLVVLGVFYYRRTVPPVSVASRRILRALRILTLAALVVRWLSSLLTVLFLATLVIIGLICRLPVLPLATLVVVWRSFPLLLIGYISNIGLTF